MWISLFGVAAGLAISFAMGSVLLEWSGAEPYEGSVWF
jgi:hypothetical protein